MPAIFFTDRYFTVALQFIPGLIITWILIGALTTRTSHERILLVTLVIIATCFEILGSLILHWYTYRLHNIPAWIPPGHGIVFFTALLAMEQTWAIKYDQALRVATTLLAVIYSAIGLVLFKDFAGAMLTAQFFIFLWLIGIQKGRFYTWLWLLIFALELSGVLLGAWHWSAHMPITGLHENNPPSGIVGAYGIFDLLAFLITAGLIWLIPPTFARIKRVKSI